MADFKNSVILMGNNCGCCGRCIGCCFCEQEPAVNADYEIDAPSCSVIDGILGNVSGPGPDIANRTPCGACIDLINDSSIKSIPVFVYDDSLPENGCAPQSSGTFSFSFLLRCSQNASSAEVDPETTTECCNNVRLILADGGGFPLAIDPIAPLACTCNPFMAMFSLESIFPDCGLGTFTSGPCIGLSRCAQLGDPMMGIFCSLAGATVTFTQRDCP
jgi:hypothetical protein